IGLLKSRPIADAVINRFNLMAIYDAKDMTAARTELQNNTTVASDTSTLISISVIDDNKKRAADMANAYTEQLRILSKTISVTEASKRRLFFEEQLKSQKEALVEAELALEQVQQSGGLVRPDAQAALIVSNLSLLRGQIAAKEVQLQGLRSYSTEHNPQVQLVERELNTMQGQAAHMEQHTQPTGYSDLGLKDVPKAGLEYARAARELQYEQALFDLLLRQFEAAKLDEAKEAAVIQVVEPGIEPERKSSPHRLLILVLSTIGGLFISCLFIWILWWRDVTRTDPQTVRAFQNLRRAFKGSL
ncbi:MAG: GNVR domain-containing protein, partial [Terracidiphilus sp.]